MNNPLPRLVRMFWKPLCRAGSAVRHGLNTFFGAGWSGLTLGFLAATLGFLGLMGAHLHTGLWRPLDVLLTVTLAALATALAALALLLLHLVFCRWRARFLTWGLGAFLVLTGMFMSFGFPLAGITMALTLAGLAGGFGLGLAVLLRKGLPRSYRIVGALFLLGATVGSVALVQWLRNPGTDAHLETQVAASGPAVSPLELPDPGLPGTHPVKFLTYGSGTDKRRPEFGPGAAFRTASVDASPFLKGFKGFQATLRRWYWGFDKDAFPLNGRVWYPEGTGPFPLVLCVHGNHLAQDFSDPGYGYLGARLASRGYIFVSVDENFLNGSWTGDIEGENAVRGWMLLKHLEAWRRWNAQAGHPFRGRADLDRVSLIGHSRGGEAVIIAATYNRLARWPEDATQAFDFGFGIRSVVAIAPIDGQYETSGVPTPVRDVDYLVLQGSHDSDLFSFLGQRVLRRLVFTDGQPHFKASLYIHRANHGQFNTVWGAKDIFDPFGHVLATGALMPGEDQRRFALVSIGAFLEATLKGRREYGAFFRDPRRGASWLPRGITFSQYQDERFKPLATFEEDIDPCTTTIPGGRIDASGLSLWKERQVKGRDDWNFRHKGVWLGWEQPEDRKAVASYTLTVPATFAQEARLDFASRLVLTLADTDENPHVDKGDAKQGTPAKKDAGKDTALRPKEPVDFTVELVDSEGHVASLPLSAIRPLQPVLKVTHVKWSLLEDSAYKSAWEPVFQTFELPLSAFLKAAPDFNGGALQSVRLRFDRSPKGVVILSQVGFAFGP